MSLGSNKWHYRYLRLAEHISNWSQDQSRQIGCVIVGPHNEIRSTGFNGVPRGLNDKDPARNDRSTGEKYTWFEHAERNAIYNAARIGVPISNCKMYVNWFPCSECARAIIQVGIEHLFCTQPDFEDPTWGTGFSKSNEMLLEAGIEISFFDCLES